MQNWSYSLVLEQNFPASLAHSAGSYSIEQIISNYTHVYILERNLTFVSSGEKVLPPSKAWQDIWRHILKRAVFDTELKLFSSFGAKLPCFPCTFCGKLFYRADHLKLHTCIHTGEKPYVCVKWGKSFAAKQSMTRHLKIHLKESSFWCSLVCSYTE